VDRKEFLIREINDLRSDLKDLKRCQLQYFSISITATGAILGFLGSATIAQNLKDSAFLVPLTVILPCWLIFFDKATTITRIVGYQRILERQITGEAFTYFGWENALSNFREKEIETWEKVKTRMPRKPLRSYFAMFIPWTRHRFWVLNWYTFLLLSLVCCLGSIIQGGGNNTFTVSFFWGKTYSCNSQYLPIVALSAVIACTGYTTYLLNLLINGRLSYKGCTLIWEKILTP
jgi:hypothetical protein